MGKDESGGAPNHTSRMNHLLYKHAWRTLIIKGTVLSARPQLWHKRLLFPLHFGVLWLQVSASKGISRHKMMETDDACCSIYNSATVSQAQPKTQCHREDLINNADGRRVKQDALRRTVPFWIRKQPAVGLDRGLAKRWGLLPHFGLIRMTVDRSSGFWTLCGCHQSVHTHVEAYKWQRLPSRSLSLQLTPYSNNYMRSYKSVWL